MDLTSGSAPRVTAKKRKGEVAPPYDSSQITAQVAARLIIDVLAARFPSR